jgi:inosine-uridine nucleoside N-ribohydrolase
MQLKQMLEYPKGKVDVVIDTDTFNEVDDQFALAYLLKNKEKLSLKAIFAAPFFNEKANSAKDGMEKSYNEIMKVLELAGETKYKEKVFMGSDRFMSSETDFIESDAVDKLISLAMTYSSKNPLYIIGIAAATNIASAILKEPKIKDKIVVIWLGGSAYHCDEMEEFNLIEDVYAAKVLFDSKVALVQLPCWGVVESFSISREELQTHLIGKNQLTTYLAQNTINEIDSWDKNVLWSKVIWDVLAVAWLLNDECKFMKDKFVHSPIIKGKSGYLFDDNRHIIKYVYRIERDILMTDLINKLTKGIK